MKPRVEEEVDEPSLLLPSPAPSEMKTTQERAAAGRSGKGEEEAEDEEEAVDEEEAATFLLAAAAAPLDLARATMVAPTAAPARAAPTATIAIDLLSEVMLRSMRLCTLSERELKAQLPRRERERESGGVAERIPMGIKIRSTRGPFFFFQLRRALPFYLRAFEFYSSFALADRAFLEGQRRSKQTKDGKKGMEGAN